MLPVPLLEQVAGLPGAARGRPGGGLRACLDGPDGAPDVLDGPQRLALVRAVVAAAAGHERRGHGRRQERAGRATRR